MINNATTEQEVSLYYRHIDSIVSTMGYRRIKTDYEHIEDGYIKAYYEDSDGVRYQSIYVLADSRGNEVYQDALSSEIVITMDKCELSDYLEYKEIPHKVVKSPIWYKMVSDYYGDKTTKRSNVRLMNHIDEGLIIIDMIKELSNTRISPTVTQGKFDAIFEKAKIQYTIHPIYQNARNGDVESDELTFLYDEQYRTLGNEYADIANDYLSTRVIDSLDDIKMGMSHTSIALLADKIQNYKDFLKYHQFTHKGSARLHQYFNNWFKKFIQEGITIEYDLYNIFNETIKW